MSKLKYEEGEDVRISNEADVGTDYDHVGEIGMITEIIYRPRNPDNCWPPPYLVQFDEGDIQDYQEYELELP